MSKISIPTHKITEEAMGEGWANWYEAAQEFAAYLESNLPEMVADEGDVVEFTAEATNDSGCVNNPCAYATVDDEDSDAMSFRVQSAKETLWERFCNERGAWQHKTPKAPTDTRRGFSTLETLWTRY